VERWGGKRCAEVAREFLTECTRAITDIRPQASWKTPVLNIFCQPLWGVLLLLELVGASI